MSVAPKWRAGLHALSKNDRHRGSDEGDAPLLGDGEVAPGDGEVVIGGEEGNQAEGKATDGLGKAEPVETEAADAWPRRECCGQFWRSRWLLAAGLWIGSAGGWGHEAGAATGSEVSMGSMPPAGSNRHSPLLTQEIVSRQPTELGIHRMDPQAQGGQLRLQPATGAVQRRRA